MRLSLSLTAVLAVGLPLLADDPRPTPATRPEMKKLIEEMKERKPRIPLPELTDADKEKLGDRGMGYEARLRYHYMGGETRTGGGGGGGNAFGFGGGGSLDGTFKTQLFWIVCRTNNCQYCQGHQEGKLLRDGMTEDQIAALDSDWEQFTPAQQAAFAFARKFTFEPHKLTDADIDALRKHYKDEQILEMTLSMAGNNAINRWKEGTGVPQGASGGGGGRGGANPPPTEKHTYQTPTSDKYKDRESKVALLDKDDKGKPTGKTLFTRAPLESRDDTEKALAAAAKRTGRLPLVSEEKTREMFVDWGKGSMPQWVRLLASDLGKSRVASQLNAEQRGDLSPLVKAQVSWIIARQDRAWYAVGLAKKSLLTLGQKEDQIYALDGDWKGFTAAERSVFTLVKKLAASPVVLTDDDVAEAIKQVGPRDVTQLINYVTVRASFDRITEAAGLPVDKDETAAPPKPAKTLKLPEGVSIEKLSDKAEAARVAELMEKEYPEPRSEAAKMLIAILKGSQLDGRDGWFNPGESRYSFKWLAEQSKLDAKAEAITKEQFAGTAEQFAALDRDGDGKLTPADLDWSDRSSYVMRASMLNGLFRRMDQSGDGKLTREELDTLFQRLAKDRDHFTADDFRRAMIPRGPMGFAPGDAPTVPMLVKGLFGNEIGSMSEGPKVGDTAPGFTLKTPDGKETVQLSKLVGTKPVVLVFGNFTCGPFRSLFPDVEAVAKRYKDSATFVMVYVREAHPTDGWKMEQNTRIGVSAKQPTSYAERVEVCEQFKKLLKPELTLAVDDIADPAGTAYSGMPARLYVIDPKGKVAYKSGRGPFGFKPGEMEQALVMCLSESGQAKASK